MDAKVLEAIKCICTSAIIDSKSCNTCDDYIYVGGNTFMSIEEVQSVIDYLELEVEPIYTTDDEDRPTKLAGWWYK